MFKGPHKEKDKKDIPHQGLGVNATKLSPKWEKTFDTDRNGMSSGQVFKSPNKYLS